MLRGQLQLLHETLPQYGKVEWIGVRPARRAEMSILKEVVVTEQQGLAGDRYAGRSRKRQITLIQYEHLSAVAACLGRTDSIAPAVLRRNLVVSGINLLALKEKQFYVGDVLLSMTGQCHPCSRMEEILGAGGYNAMRGHGGINAKVIRGGTIRVGDKVYYR